MEREPLEKSATFPVSERLLGLAPYHMTSMLSPEFSGNSKTDSAEPYRSLRILTSTSPLVPDNNLAVARQSYKSAAIRSRNPDPKHIRFTKPRDRTHYPNMAEQVNVLLSSFPGLSLPSTVSFALPSVSTLSDLTEKVISLLPSSVPFQSLILTTTNNKQVVPSSDRLQSLLVSRDGESSITSNILPLRLTVPLCGGKGGFGSQLRAAGGRMSSKRKRTQGDDNASSRNLDGRRIRTVNEAKALAEYLAVKPEMDQKEKEERRRRWQSVVEVAEKRQEELKNGGGKHKVDGQWMDDKEEMNEKAREAVMLAMKEGAWTDNLRDTIMGGSSTSASEGSENAASSSSGEESEEENMAESSSGSNQASAAPRKFIGFDDDDEFMSDSEEEEEPEGKGKGKA